MALASLVKLINQNGALNLTILNQQLIKLIKLIGINAVAVGLNIVTINYTVEQVFKEIKLALLQSLLYMDLAILESKRKAELVDKIWSQYNEAKSLFKVLLFKGIPCLTTILGSSYNLYSISPMLSNYLIVTLPSIYLVLYFYGNILRSCRKQCMNSESYNQGLSMEIMNGIRTVRAYAMEEKEIENYDENLTQLIHYNNLFSFHLSLFKSFINLSLGLTTAGIFYMGANNVVKGSLLQEDLIAYLLTVQNMQRALDLSGSIFGQIMKGRSSIKNIIYYIQLPSSSTLKSSKNLKPLVSGKIDFVINHFEYKDQQPVLKNVRLTIPPGTTLALCGASGSGKSTIAALLERFYDLNENQGHIFIDGINIQDYEPNYLRGEIIAYLEQEPTLFKGTIKDNIVYGSKYTVEDVQEIQQAAELANAWEFIENLSDGLDTVIDEKGSNLSGGQKQRISIARAIIKNPKILILDEATSALDTISEKKVQNALYNLMKNKTTLIIAHRLSTIVNADNIALLQSPKNNNSVVEQGSHDMLLKLKGKYFELFYSARDKHKDTIE
ncbi:P-loop containing nucleoside triphosphate hydrolase protein [Neoconidiobolus thromboides FSU 785]|nr:P-loop containing nucleoside triphosphate hydrolase protein [Neoconidiobolus thromboides FSU 785]